jgi:hypothetical protein
MLSPQELMLLGAALPARFIDSIAGAVTIVPLLIDRRARRSKRAVR